MFDLEINITYTVWILKAERYSTRKMSTRHTFGGICLYFFSYLLSVLLENMGTRPPHRALWRLGQMYLSLLILGIC